MIVTGRCDGHRSAHVGSHCCRITEFRTRVRIRQAGKTADPLHGTTACPNESSSPRLAPRHRGAHTKQHRIRVAQRQADRAGHQARPVSDELHVAPQEDARHRTTYYGQSPPGARPRRLGGCGQARRPALAGARAPSDRRPGPTRRESAGARTTPGDRVWPPPAVAVVKRTGARRTPDDLAPLPCGIAGKRNP
jgi:hypothetical protein